MAGSTVSQKSLAKTVQESGTAGIKPGQAEAMRIRRRKIITIEITSWILMSIVAFTIYQGFVAVRDWAGL